MIQWLCVYICCQLSSLWASIHSIQSNNHYSNSSHVLLGCPGWLAGVGQARPGQAPPSRCCQINWRPWSLLDRCLSMTVHGGHGLLGVAWWGRFHWLRFVAMHLRRAAELAPSWGPPFVRAPAGSCICSHFTCGGQPNGIEGSGDW